MSITTSSGTTILLDTQGEDIVVIFENPSAPPDMRHAEAGRLVDGGFQPAPFAPWGLRPETLRALADLIDEVTR